jgi:RHS repeat-associated protein
MILDSPRAAGRQDRGAITGMARSDVSRSGSVERWLHTPYGEPTVHEDSGYGDRDGDGDVDATDKGILDTPQPATRADREASRGLRPLRRVQDTGTVAGSCRILDLDFDGDYDATDGTKFDALPSGIRRQPGRQSSGLSQPFGHQGLVYDAEIGSYQNRARQYHPALRKYIQRDVLDIGLDNTAAYRDGMNSYCIAGGNTLTGLDPTGMHFDVWICFDLCRLHTIICEQDAQIQQLLCFYSCAINQPANPNCVLPCMDTYREAHAKCQKQGRICVFWCVVTRIWCVLMGE